MSSSSGPASGDTSPPEYQATMLARYAKDL